jgi:putative holliday junction resolvase
MVSIEANIRVEATSYPTRRRLRKIFPRSASRLDGSLDQALDSPRMPPRVLGLDVGSKTIGVAVTDELGMSAHPVTTLVRKGTAPDVAAVRALAEKYGAGRAVIGMPYDEEGNEGPRAKRVRVFLEALAATGLAVEPWDERFSTIEAEEVLLEADLSRRKRKKVIDRLAAQIILQNWLEAQ